MTEIGIQTRLWGVSMHRSNLAELLAQVIQSGYAGIEIGAQHLDLDNPEYFGRLLADNGLRTASLHVAGQYDDPPVAKKALEEIDQVIRFGEQIGATFITVSGVEKVHKPGDEIRRASEHLNYIGEKCARHGLKLCHHNHYWEIQDDCRELRIQCEFTDPALVSLCLDIGWVQRAGVDPNQVIEAYFDRIGYLHLRDSTADQWVAIGQGEVDFSAVINLVGKETFPWLVVEMEPIQGLKAALRIATESRKYLKDKCDL